MISDYEFRQQKFGGGQILYVIEKGEAYVSQINGFEPIIQARKATRAESEALLQKHRESDAERPGPVEGFNDYYCTEGETPYKSGGVHESCIVCGADFEEGENDNT